jgi:hypothetical protein
MDSTGESIKYIYYMLSNVVEFFKKYFLCTPRTGGNTIICIAITCSIAYCQLLGTSTKVLISLYFQAAGMILTNTEYGF